ncbi:plasmid mobilization protein [Stenotrophomonas acidaminiphila]|uniref:plasmid mobilization protein n=1 Tax=Stenotrophomonas acidaminiphila TaxID=128780 RepID=UPI003BF09ABB
MRKLPQHPAKEPSAQSWKVRVCGGGATPWAAHRSVTPEEEAAIANLAAQTCLSNSGYLRAVGLNQPVRSVLDLKAVADLGHVNDDLGRVAGLLKLWLAEKRGQGARPVEVESLMIEFRALQTRVMDVMDVMGRVVRDAVEGAHAREASLGVRPLAITNVA